jgi:MFS family permease
MMLLSMLDNTITHQSGILDGIDGGEYQSLSSTSSDSSREGGIYSNLFLPLARSLSFKTDQQLHGAAVIRNDSLSASARTAVTSNIHFQDSLARVCISPPNCIDADDDIHNMRSIFGLNTQKKYNLRRGEIIQSKPKSQYNKTQQTLTSSSSDMSAKSIFETSSEEKINIELRITADETISSTLLYTPGTHHGSSSPPLMLTVGYQKEIFMSPLTPAHSSHTRGRKNHTHSKKIRIDNSDDESCSSVDAKDYAVQFNPLVPAHYNNNDDTHNGSCTSSNDINTFHRNPSQNIHQQHQHHQHHHHSQAFLLSLAFFFLWSPQNLLAPNLTQAAHDFGYDEENTHARDMYLGSNLALAGSVLSLPISAFIGFASDVVPSRMVLMSATTLVGGMAAIGTGMATTYPQLILCRFVGGSCMSGSVPVVFSLLSDWFDDKDRNSASSGFTAMMGSGIILGQVYAGCTGPSAGWRHPFYASGILTMILAVLVIVCVREPVRGGKEKALREMLACGGKYERKLTWSQFVSSITNHRSNRILMIQGFFSNIPWGVMFVFLNDFLSQERGLSVPDATFIVAVFGVGCAHGGILGGT